VACQDVPLHALAHVEPLGAQCEGVVSYPMDGPNAEGPSVLVPGLFAPSTPTTGSGGSREGEECERPPSESTPPSRRAGSSLRVQAGARRESQPRDRPGKYAASRSASSGSPADAGLPLRRSLGGAAQGIGCPSSHERDRDGCAAEGGCRSAPPSQVARGFDPELAGGAARREASEGSPPTRRLAVSPYGLAHDMLGQVECRESASRVSVSTPGSG